MRSSETYYILGMGDSDDWKNGDGHIYYISARNQERCIPVFTTPKKAQRYANNHFKQPEAYLDMLESVGPNSGALREGRYSLIQTDTDTLALAAATVDADYLVRDPRPGRTQEILRFRKNG